MQGYKYYFQDSSLSVLWGHIPSKWCRYYTSSLWGVLPLTGGVSKEFVHSVGEEEMYSTLVKTGLRVRWPPTWCYLRPRIPMDRYSSSPSPTEPRGHLLPTWHACIHPYPIPTVVLVKAANSGQHHAFSCHSWSADRWISDPNKVNKSSLPGVSQSR